jgi:hypothetical protein
MTPAIAVFMQPIHIRNLSCPSSALVVALGACLSLLAPLGLASAQSTHFISGVRPEGHLSLGGHGDFGAGFRIDIPIVPDGFISSLNDEFALSPGLDVQFFDLNRHEGDRNLLLIPQLATQWNFYLPRDWSVFPELGVALVFGAGRRYRGDVHRGDDFHADPLVAFGARYHFSSRNSLVMRLGYPSGFQIGLTF